MKHATPVVLLVLLLVTLTGCKTTRPDPCQLQDSVANTSATKQTQARAQAGASVAEDGNASLDQTDVGLDIQSGATAAANPVTVHPLVGGEKAAASLLSTQTPQERALALKLDRIQKQLELLEAELAVLDPQDARRGPTITRRNALEKAEDTLTEQLGTVYTAKLDAARELVPSLESLERVTIAVWAPQVTSSGRTMSDAQATAAKEAFQAYLQGLEGKDQQEGGGE